MTTLEYHKLVLDRNALRACFVRDVRGFRDAGMAAHELYLFTHCYLLLRPYGLIWETTRPLGTTGFSQDKYHDGEAVQIAIPIGCDAAMDVLRASPHYGSCSTAVGLSLRRLGFDIPRHDTPDAVFFRLREIVGHHTDTGDLYALLTT